MQIKMKILDARLKDQSNHPSYGSPGSAGMDLRAMLDAPLTLSPNEVKLIKTGLSIFIDNPNYAVMLLPRSGMGHKNGIVLGNLVGLIDSDYQGELMISCWNRSENSFTINPMDRIAQMVVVPVVQPTFEVVDTFEASARGEGGFGHTGHQ